MALSRKPLMTYTRRSRTRANSKANTQTSSPLEPLPTDMEDVTITEMTRRMQKRSRQSTSSNDDRQIGEEPLKIKKIKNDVGKISDSDFRGPLLSGLSSVHGETTIGKSACSSHVMFRTPHPPFCSEATMLPSSAASSEHGDLSPLPIARHKLSRTSSRHLKENCSRDLGSPFNSRPGSRAASPSMAYLKRKGKGKSQMPSHHAMSRTLSEPLDSTTFVYASQGFLGNGANDAAAEDILSTRQLQKRPSISLHHRTGSIPTAPSAQAGDDWLAHSATLSHIPRLDTSPIHSSFFLDIPNEASTPPRKRRATINGMRVETQDFDLTLSDMSVDPNLSTDAYTRDMSRPNSPGAGDVSRRPPLRLRRRTITNPSGGSLFSSVLDFSRSAAEQRSSFALDVHGIESHQQNSSINPRSEEHTSLATAFSGLNVGLASAFTPITHTAQPAFGHVLHRSASLPTLYTSPVSAGSHNVSDVTFGGSPKELGSLGSPETQLKDLFVTLHLEDDGKNARASTAVSYQSTDVVVSAPHMSLLCPPLQPLPQTSRGQQTHKRQRADTIRASDFVLPSANQDTSGNTSGRAYSQRPVVERGVIVTNSASRAGRTRSGTVTLASIAASQIASRRVTGRTNDSSSQVPASPLRGHKRSNARWPTIQMKIHDEPLKLAPGDDEDDELLLKRGSTID